jgi:single-stranded-DNA-specific exonuclease
LSIKSQRESNTVPPLNKRWEIATKITPSAEENLTHYPPILRQILFNRGYATREEAAEFLEARITGERSPFGLKGVVEAVERIGAAIHKQEQIIIFGDYDTDGVCSTVLMVQTITALGGRADAYIPDRFTEGYGLNNKALERLQDDGAKLIITVDCGIRALNEVAHGKKLGLDMIITDHHTPGTELPHADIVINPKQPEDTYANKNLAGVGTAYKLACALIEELQPERFGPERLIDLVALGTVADLVPLVGENRALVREGLQQMGQPRRQGLLALMGVAGVKPHQIKASSIGFGLGPRINAAGRLASAMDAYELLVTEDVFRAGQLAQQLDNRNRERQKITQTIVEEAEALALANNPDALLLSAAHVDFNAGVVGLAAARLVEQYYRPAIVGHRGETVTRASCRSIPEFHITEALNECADLLDHYGGHAAAAGFTVENRRLPELIERLSAIAEEKLKGLDLLPTMQADAEVDLSDLKPELLKHLDWLEPIGYGNPEAVFATRDVKISHKRAVGRENAHLKLTLTDGSLTYDAIAFRQGHLFETLPKRVDLMCSFELNDFNGRQSLQLNVKDIKAASA